ncbi:GntR family transcriptional regulator [Variovorax sp. YR216]|uniref:GntR family transcriptional regulator n=1 Tax=Variovorax sp. YR216 TaxID=1882828 RepID=UPI002109A2BC|nr:GntR family transcriptional regulator [Variovorax sp. YR216]
MFQLMDTDHDPSLLSDEDTSGDESRRRGGRANEIRTALQEEIESGSLPPGAPLDERALAARFQVSRTPVREALQQLAARDLVRIAPRQGVTVARLSINQVRAIMESIGELEALAAKLAARRVDDPLRKTLDEAVQRCQDAAVQGGAAEYAIANTFFHETVYDGARNPYLAELIRNARRQIQRYRLKDFQTKAQISKSLQDHLRVARAIQEGDEALAAQAMLLHVPSGSTGFSEFLARMPMSFFESDSADH